MNSLAKIVACACLIVPFQAGATIDDLVCDDTVRLERQLEATQGATRISQGMRGPDALMEVWMTPRNGDWVLVQTYANGTSCIVAMGQHWEMTPPKRDPA